MRIFQILFSDLFLNINFILSFVVGVILGLMIMFRESKDDDVSDSLERAFIASVAYFALSFGLYLLA